MPEFVSERDFVAQSILPQLKEAARSMKVIDTFDFHVDARVDGGIADLYGERGGKRLFVVEAKFKKKVGRVERDIEPRDPEVIKQAVGYAVYGGFPYYLTCNTKRIILFKLQPGKSPLESEILSCEYEPRPKWAEDILEIILGRVAAQLKPIDDTLVNTMQEAFADLYPEILGSLKERLKKESFKSKYDDWLRSQGLEIGDDTNRLIAQQSTYLQLNKLLFYHVLRVIYPERLKPLKIEEEEDVADSLGKFYSDARNIDYAPVYQSDIISEIPLTTRSKERFRTLLDTMNEFDFSKMESDFIGRVYEKLIPPIERKRLGQFYTPPAIVDLIIQLTLNKGSYKILDPGCGSGSFLVKAYNKLRELNGFPKEMKGNLSENYHKQLLDQVFGVDINQFPAHLSVINLALQNPKSKTDRVNIVVNDFFNLTPGHETLSGFESITAEGEQATVELPPYFDLVVANPPYIRQELVGDKEKKKIKALIEKEYKNRLVLGANSSGSRRAISLNKQSDIYVYFYIHGLNFLKKGGNLGFISSNKWLEVQYGESFQQFLLSSCKIRYVIEFDRAVFPDAEVNTEVTIIEKADGDENANGRKENLVKFVHINKAFPLEEMIRRIESEEVADDEYLRIVSVKQVDLAAGKWNLFLRSPLVYFSLLKNSKLKRFEEIAEVYYGLKTGYDPYFILDKDGIKQWKIERRYLKPCAPPGKSVRGLVIEPIDISQYFLVVHEPKNKLKGTNALRYIEHGEQIDAEASKRRKEPISLPKVETIRGRNLWYELPNLPTPSIIFPMWFRYQYRPLVNNANVQAQDFYYYIVVKEEDKYVIAALLYSTITQFFLELMGRQYSGMLHTKVYELKQLPFLDPSFLTKVDKEKLALLFQELSEATSTLKIAVSGLKEFTGKSENKGLFEDQAKDQVRKARAKRDAIVSKIDEIVYDVLELPNRDRLDIVRGLKRLRVIRKEATRGLKVKEEE